MEEPRAWVGCLGCYNAGALVGQWVDGTEAGDFEPHDALIRETSQGDARDSYRHVSGPPCGREKSDERWVFDHAGYGGLLSGECSPSEAERLAETVERIEAAGYGVEAVAAWRDYVGAEYANLSDLSEFEDAYCGEWSSEQDYATQLAEDIGAINEDATWPNNYIDWERATRDLFMGDYWSADSPGGVFVFRSC